MRNGLFAAVSLIALALTAGAALSAPADQAPPKDKDPAAALPPVEAGVADLTRVSPGWTYFNKPGADLDAQNADLKYCASIAPLGTQPRELLPQSGGLLGALINMQVIKMEVRRGIAANTENCMVVRGWRVVQIADDEGERLAKLDQASLSEQLKLWVGSDAPHGHVVRSWDNDLLKAKTEKFRDAGPVEHPSLSLTALAKDLDAPIAGPLPAPVPPKSARLPKNIKADKIAGATLGPDEALIIVRLKHPGFHNGIGLTLERMGPDPDTPAWFADQKPAALVAGAGLLFSKAEGSDYAFVVPAGTWRLAGIGIAFSSASYCLGSPAIEVKPGQVVYAGSFDFGGEDLGPDLNLDPAKALLAKAPELQAKLQPAQWTNGTTSVCRGAYFYALEIKGAPSRPGYVRGNAPLPKPVKGEKADAPPAESSPRP